MCDYLLADGNHYLNHKKQSFQSFQSVWIIPEMQKLVVRLKSSQPLCVCVFEGSRWAEKKVAEHVSELSPEQKSPHQQHACLQKRITAHGAVSPQLPNPVHPAVGDHSAVRARGSLAQTCTRSHKNKCTKTLSKCSVQVDLGRIVLQNYLKNKNLIQHCNLRWSTTWVGPAHRSSADLGFSFTNLCKPSNVPSVDQKLLGSILWPTVFAAKSLSFVLFFAVFYYDVRCMSWEKYVWLPLYAALPGALCMDEI